MAELRKDPIMGRWVIISTERTRRALANALKAAPLREVKNRFYHWHLEITPALTRVAGFEVGTGFYINPMPPEEAARILHEALNERESTRIRVAG